MANQALVNYIRNAVSSGAAIASIRQKLVQEGYNQAEVDDAIHSAFGTEVRHTINLSKSAIAAIIIIAAAAGLVTMFVTQQAPTKLLDFESLPLKTTVKPGETLSYQVRLLNTGSKNIYDVIVRSEVVNSKGEVICVKTDTFAVETRTSETMQIEIPNTADPGSYSVRSKAMYPGGEAISTFDIKVYAEESCNDRVQNQGESGIDCGGPCKPCTSCNDRRKNYDEEGVDCGGPCETDCCSNNIQDPAEDGIDCGGKCKPCSCGNCDDNNPCTEDTCEGKCVHRQITPCCGDGVCEKEEACENDCSISPQEKPEQIIEKAQNMATVAPDKAEAMCEALADSQYRDLCLELSAKNSNQSSMCNGIYSTAKRDACYMEFAMQGDYSVCYKVENEYLVRACEQLKYLQSNT
ncbi:MAG: hypothetical protein ABIF10_04165 [Candidatus Woesearchaeota archaeon]